MKDNLSKTDFEKTWPLHIRRYTTYLIAGYYRRKHVDLTNQYIADRLNKWGIDLSHNGLIQPRLIKLLGQLSMLHTRNQEDVLKLDYISNGYSADYIHPRFLAEMLRLGDLLDADNSRFESAAELVTGELPQDSAGHKGKHEATVHLLITPEQIEYRADCPNHGVYRETRRFLDWLENELTFAAINWLNFIPKELGGTAPRLTKKELLLNGKPDIDNTSDLRFGISQEKAFEIIEGSGIYNDKLVFLRELIQNTEDASKIQLWRDLQKRPDLYLNEGADKDNLSHIQPYDLKSEAFDSYKITIDMEKESGDTIRIRVIDRGTGMSVDTVKQMCKVGTSYHQDKARRREIESMPAWLRPTAGFGVGLQSVFLVAPVFTIYSRTEEKAIKVTVESRKKEGYVQVEEDDFWKEQGTCIELLIKSTDPVSVFVGGSAHHFLDEKYDQFDNEDCILYYSMIDTIYHNCSCSLFPIQTVKNNSEWISIDRLLFPSINRENSVEINNCIISKAAGGGINIWDKKEYTNCHIWYSMEKFSSLAFKGKIMSGSTGMFLNPASNISSRFDFYGLDTRAYLEISRNRLRSEKVIDIAKKVTALFHLLVEFLLRQDNPGEWIGIDVAKLQNKPDADIFYILWQMGSDIQKNHMIEDPDKYIDSMTTETEILRWDGERYAVQKINVKEIILRPQNFFFCNSEKFFQHPSQLHNEDEKAKAAFMNNCTKIAKDISETDIVLYDDIKRQFSNKHISELRYYTNRDKIAVYKLSSDSSTVCKVDIETRKNLLRSLSEDSRGSHINRMFFFSSRRKGIPAIEGYEKIAFSYEKTPVRYMWGGLAPTTYIISPILSDEKRIRYPKDEFISLITTTPEFHNLVNYVLEHRADPTPCTEEDIIETYKRLLSEYYDVMHEDETVKEESEGE